MARVRRGVLAGGLIVLALGLGASPASAVVTFGSTLPAPTPGYSDSCTDACTTALLELPGATVTAPVSGTIVRFRLRTGAGSDPQSIKFRVLRSADGVKFTGAGTSAAVALPTTAGITEFTVNMPVRQGDYIGIDEPAGNKQANVVAENAAAFQAGWFPALADGGTARASGNPKGSPPTVFDLLLQADIEPTASPAPTPSPTPTPAPTPASTLVNCTNSLMVATCPAPGGPPSMCGPTSLGFAQCNVPFNVPTACSGTGTALPVCNLPGNYIVACGGFGLGLAVCDLPPVTVPQVCGPTTVGLPPCAASNTQVLACGPATVGLPACNFKTLIKAPAPIDVSSGALDLELSCPDDAQATSAGAHGAGARTSRSTCAAEIDLAALIDAKVSSLIGEGNGRCDFAYFAYLVGGTTEEERARNRSLPDERTRTLWANLVSCNYRARQLALDYLHSDLRSGYTGEAFTRATSADDLRIRKVLQSQHPNYPRTTAGPYQGPPGLWQNEETFRQTRLLAASIVAAVNEVYALQERAKRGGAKASAVATVPRTPAARLKPLLRTRVTVRRGARATRIRLRLPRSTVRALRRRASRTGNAVAVRLVVSFKAKPRPIVRFVDFRLPTTSRSTPRQRKPSTLRR